MSLGKGQGIVLLHVVATDKIRGAEKFSLELSTELSKQGIRQGAVSLAPVKQEGGSRAPLIQFAVRAKNSLSAVARVRSLMASARPSVVLCHGTSCLKAVVLARLLLSRSYRPRIYLIKIGMTEPWLRRFKAIRIYIDRLFLAHAEAVVVLGPSQKMELNTLLRYPVEKTHLIPNARRRPDGYVKKRISAEKIVLFIGAMEHEKNPFGALIVFMTARSVVPGTKLKMIGDGSLLGQLKEYVEANNIADSVSFLGHVDDVWRHLADASVLIVCSHTEGSPGVIIEALLASVPVVAWDVGDVSFALDQMPGCSVSPYGDVSHLGKSLVSAISGGSGSLQDAQIAARAYSMYSITEVADKYHQLLFGKPLGLGS